MWNAHAYGLLDVPVQVDPVAEARAAAFGSRWAFTMPAAVREWVVGDWRDWARGPSVDLPPRSHQLKMLSEEGPGLLTWTQHLLLDGDLTRAEPRRLRYQILHVAARITRAARRTHLRIHATWPWASDLATAFGRLTALPRPAT